MSRVADYRTHGTVSGTAACGRSYRSTPAYLDTAESLMELVEAQEDLNVHLYGEADNSTEHLGDLMSRFAKLAAEWKEESRFMSSPVEMANLSSYRQIIALGQPVVPLLLKELKDEPNHWFWALWMLTGENPVPPTCAGDIEKMASAWLLWGSREGYVI